MRPRIASWKHPTPNIQRRTSTKFPARVRWMLDVRPLASARRQRASILVGLLWCLAVVAVVVIGVLHTARLDLIVVKNYGDRIQAHYLALAGIEKAKALL